MGRTRYSLAPMRLRMVGFTESLYRFHETCPQNGLNFCETHYFAARMGFAAINPSYALQDMIRTSETLVLAGDRAPG